MTRTKLVMRAGLVLLLLVPLGCSHNGSKSGGGGGGSGGGSGGGNGNGGDAGIPEDLVVTPANPVLDLQTGQPAQTVQFMATKSGTPITNAQWSIDRGELGSIDANGLFTPSGTLGGVAVVTAAAGASDRGTTTVTIHVSTTENGDPAYPAPTPGAGGYGGVGGDGPGAPPSTTQTGTLMGTPTMDTSVSLLYPYDKTVWPRGLLAPLLQWNPGTHHFDSAYIHVTEANFEYDGYFAANSTTNFQNLPIPQDAWHQMTYSNAGEMMTISIVLGEGGQAYGPYTETWRIAPATLKGTIYYNSYGTYLVQNSGTDGLDATGHQYGAGTLAIKAGDTSPTLVAGVSSPAPGGDGTGCRVCHTVAANGKSLVTQASNLSATDYSVTKYLDLLNDTTGGSGTALTTTTTVGQVYPALYPDGSLMLANAGGFNGGQYPLPPTSVLYSLPDGAPVMSMGLPDNFQATLPVFSPDGKSVAFNFWSGTFTGGPTGDQRSLAILDFDLPSKTFSNPRIGYTPPANTPVSFSSFLPDSSGVVFSLQLAAPFGATWHQATSELWWYDLKANQAHRLDNLNGLGYAPNNGSTHPAGLDATLNYEPTVNPIASGGYAWVVFTSRRMYGNVAAEDPWMSDPRNFDATQHITDKKLWVAAFDLSQDEISTVGDPSHPAFYLPAQELRAGNARGYWSVDPCHADGATCDTGDECCGGYCSSENGALVCTSQKPQCSAEFDKCTTTADCCGTTPALSCINSICTQAVPIS